MANVFGGARVETVFYFTCASGTVFEVGDLVYFDSSTYTAKLFSDLTDNTSEERNQAEVAVNFLGRVAVPSPSGSTTVGVDICESRLVHDVTVPSGTYRIGSLLGPSEDSGNDGLEDQQLEAVTSIDIATHVVMDDSASARTTVLASPLRSVLIPRPTRRSQCNTETLAGAKVLTHDDAHFQFLDPGGAGRNVDLPAEEESAGLTFVIANKADAAEIITIRNDAGGTVCTPTQSETAVVFCDGTTWAGLVGASS